MTDNPETNAVEEAVETTQTAPEPQDKPAYFDENFDPSSLPPDLQPAYNQMRGAFTQKTQEVAAGRAEIEQNREYIEFVEALETDPDTRRAVYDHLAAEFSDAELDAMEDDDGEPVPLYDPRVDDLIHKQEIQEVSSYASSEFDRLGISNADHQLTVLQLAGSPGFPLTRDGHPDIEGAQQRLGEYAEQDRQRYVSSKTNAATPPANGIPGQSVMNWKDRNSRIAAAAAHVEAAQAAEN